MPPVQEIDIHKVKEMDDRQNATIVDIRDLGSYQAKRIPTAIHLSDDNVQEFISSADKEKPLVLYCYHGISSQGAAAYFSGQGFKEVYSMTGGFEGWQAAFPNSSEDE